MQKPSSKIQSQWNNTAKFVRYGFKKLHDLQWAPIRTDKTKKIIVIHKDDLHKLHQNTFRSSVFRIQDEPDDAKIRRLRIRYFQLAKAIGNIEGEDTGSHLRKSANAPRNTLLSTLRLTVKDSKPQNQNTIRPIISSANHSFRAMVRWLTSKLWPHVKALQHCLQTTEKARNKIRSTMLDPMDKLVKLDVKDFYLSGVF